MAAWAQISGNIANIFGLDPAKAAEARRGQQQEDYNEVRNKNYLDQLAANDEIGKLLGGPGFDPTKGEFVDPASFSRYAGLLARFHPESVNGAVHMSVGYADRAEKARLAAIKAEYEGRNDLEGVRAANRQKAIEDAAERRNQEALAHAHASLLAFGNKGRAYNPDVALNRIEQLVGYGDESQGIPAMPGGWVKVTDATKDLPDDQKKYEVTPQFAEWQNKAGYKLTSLPEQEFNALGDNTGMLAHTADRVGALLHIPGNSAVALNLAKRMMIQQYKDASPIFKSDRIAVNSPEDLNAALQAAAQPNGPKTIVARFPTVSSDGRTGYSYQAYPASYLLDPKSQEILGKNHPVLRYKEAR
jgi:hypothetical protein